jgi:clan AA aspartic protease
VVGHEAQVGVTVRRADQPDIEITFVVDTGFEGALSLPPAAITALGLPYFTQLNANLADDSRVRTDVFATTIVWNGAEVDVAVLAIGRRPLLGTVLLLDKRLCVDFEGGGLVSIEDLA